MATKGKLYEACLLEKVLEQIKNEKELTKSAKAIIDTHYTKRLSDGSNFKVFQEYYFKLKHSKEIDNFKAFRKHYSLQGITTQELQELEDEKSEIAKFIMDGYLPEAYFRFFIKEKDYGSFFTKVAHTYRPQEYSPIDIPMRKHFQLENENYYTSMVVISEAFKMWGAEKKEKMEEMRCYLVKVTNDNLETKITADNVTDIKVMNVIFWSLANPQK